ncbi:MAG: hypothetical protein EA398_16470 [Deltaproteobacteria bacterium]|nr:MAG: hypothetical protein EA398_16470 [Deltaproteobacteria bacterium]
MEDTPSLEARATAIRAFNEGVVAAQADRMDEAIARWEAALQADPFLVPAARNLAIWCEEQQDWETAERHWNRLLDSDPFHTEALVRRAFTLRRLGRNDDAIACYERAIGVYPWFRFWYQELASLLEEAGRDGEAGTWRDRANKLDADEAEMAFEDGVRNLRQDNLPLAIACFEAILEEFPGNTEARLRLASAYERDGRASEAAEELDTALDLTDTARGVVLFRRALYRIRQGDLAGARDDLELALGDEPGFLRARQLLGWVVAGQGDTAATTAEADESWTRAIARILADLPGDARMALAFQPASSVAAAVDQIVASLQSLGLAERCRLVEAELIPRPGQGVRQAGLLGSDDFPEVDTSGWGSGPALTQLEPLLAAAMPDGEPAPALLLIVSSGRLRADGPAVLERIKSAAGLHIVALGPPDALTDLTRRVQPVAERYTELALEG